MKSPIRLDLKRLGALTRALHALYRPAAPADFPRQMVRVLENVLGSELVAYNEFPSSRDEVAVVSNVTFDPDGRLLPVFLELFHENPLSSRLFEQRFFSPLRITDVMAFRQFNRTRIYNEFYKKIGGDFQMAAVFPGRNGNIIGLAANQQRRDFTDQELFLFQILFPHLQQAYELHQLHTALAAELASMSGVLRERSLSLVQFNAHGRVELVAGGAEEICWRFFHCRPRPGILLPNPLRECVRHLAGPAHAELPSPRRPLLYTAADGSPLLLRLLAHPESERQSLVFEREETPPTLEQLAPLGLSRRETEIVHWVLRGKTNWETGTLLGISGRTVEKHLENIFAKLGVSERTHLRLHVRTLCGPGR